MTEEPYRWLEAVANRREYVREQMKGASPVLAACLPEGILLLGVGVGQSKVFELFDRHALAGLGHPADIEKIRQVAIDAAHLEAFTRAAEDVSLRRLVGLGLSAQLKSNFEQIFAAPFLVELLLAEVGAEPAKDLLFRLHFDGTFQFHTGGVMVAASQSDLEPAAQAWLARELAGKTEVKDVADRLLQAWWCLKENQLFGDAMPGESERQSGWRAATKDRTIELGWLARRGHRPARFEPLTAAQIGL